MATPIGRSFCFSALCVGLALMLITLCAFTNKAGARSSAPRTRAITSHSSSLLGLVLFVLAQALFVLGLGCFVGKHTLVQSLRERLDEHALQDVLSEYQHIAGCNSTALDNAEGVEEGGFSCEASRLAWADAERVFRRQLDTIGWAQLLGALLLSTKLVCARHVAAADAAKAGADGGSAAAAGGGGKTGERGEYAALAGADEQEAGVSRGSPAPLGRTGSRMDRTGSRLGPTIPEASPLAESGAGGLSRQYTVEDLGDDYRGGMSSDLLSQTSFDSADITDSYGPSSGSHFRGFSAADMADGDGGELGDLAGGSGGALCGGYGERSPGVSRRGSLQLSIPEQVKWQQDLLREGWSELYDTASGRVYYHNKNLATQQWEAPTLERRRHIGARPAATTPAAAATVEAPAPAAPAPAALAPAELPDADDPFG